MYGTVDTVEQVDAVFIYIVVFALILLVFITGLMGYFTVRYRRSRNPVPTDIRGNWRLELIWTLIPTAIALSMFYVGWNSYLGLRTVPKDAINVQVIGQQFSWVFIMPNGKASEGELVVPQNKPIKLDITSQDVIHSLFIPAFRIKVDAVSGMKTHAWFYPDKIGKYDILCTEFCGVGHADMTAVLRIVNQEKYQKWLEE